MGWDVHLHVCFACDANDGVALLAARHRELLSDTCVEAGYFLEDLSHRTGPNRGRKGGLSLWGMVGNHTDVQLFCDILKPFWTDLLTEEIEGSPEYFERIMVFEEQEQTESATAYQISMPADFSWGDARQHVEIKVFSGLPFSWNQS